MSRERSRATLDAGGRGRAATTVERVLPWRRQGGQETEALTPLLAAFRERHPKSETTMIIRAFDVAERAHEGQLRKSGESYISHPLAVATILAGLSLDDTTIAAALLHDAVEDTGLTITDLESDFGPAVASIVDGVTKLERIRFDSKQAQQAATMRKMLVAMAKDPRVLLIKLADRLHNMRTIAAMPEWKQKRTAQETLDIYAPLAHRFGIQDIKWQLEDLGLRHPPPPPLRRDRADGGHPGPRAGDLPGPGDRPGPGPARRRPYRRRRVRAAQAPVFHLRENGRQGQGVRRDLRPRRGTGPRRFGQGLLGVARRRAWRLDPDPGAVQGLHQHAQVQPVPVAAHDGGRAPGQAARAADPHRRDAQPGRAGHRRPLGLQGTGVGSGRRLAAAHRRLAAGDAPTRPSSSRP